MHRVHLRSYRSQSSGREEDCDCDWDDEDRKSIVVGCEPHEEGEEEATLAAGRLRDNGSCAAIIRMCLRKQSVYRSNEKAIGINITKQVAQSLRSLRDHNAKECAAIFSSATRVLYLSQPVRSIEPIVRMATVSRSREHVRCVCCDELQRRSTRKAHRSFSRLLSGRDSALRSETTSSALVSELSQLQLWLRDCLFFAATASLSLPADQSIGPKPTH